MRPRYSSLHQLLEHDKTNHPIIFPQISQESLILSHTSNHSIRRRIQHSHNKMEITPQTVRSQSPVSQYQQQFFDAIINEDCKLAYKIIVDMMIAAVNQDNLILLIRLFKIAAQMLLHFNEYCKSLIFAKNCIFLSEFQRDFESIQWSLLHMGILCKNIRKFEIGKIFIKKSIEYAWYMNNHDEELICYEELGKLCFLNSELDVAKQLHDMCMSGDNRTGQIIQISKRGIQQLINNYPKQQTQIDQNILAKIVDFPFILRTCNEPRDCANFYLRKQLLEVVAVDRLYPQNVEEVLNKILQNHNFFFEIPMPVENVQMVAEPLTRKERIKSTQQITWIKLAIKKQQTPEYKFLPKPRVQKVDKPKLSLDQAVTERLKEKIRGSLEILQQMKYVKLKNAETIRLTHEKEKQRIHEHSKRDLLKMAEQCFQKNNKISFSLLLQ